MSSDIDLMPEEIKNSGAKKDTERIVTNNKYRCEDDVVLGGLDVLSTQVADLDGGESGDIDENYFREKLIKFEKRKRKREKKLEK
jgi:hypothetical protein